MDVLSFFYQNTDDGTASCNGPTLSIENFSNLTSPTYLESVSTTSGSLNIKPELVGSHTFQIKYFNSKSLRSASSNFKVISRNKCIDYQARPIKEALQINVQRNLLPRYSDTVVILTEQ